MRKHAGIEPILRGKPASGGAPLKKSSILAAFVAVAMGWSLSPGYSVAVTQDEPNEEVLDLIIEFVQDADRETRAIGLQQIREELPGEKVTQRLVQLFPELSTDAQVELLDAFGDRGDVSAHPLVLKLLASDNQALRLAAIRAAGALGSAEDVRLLAEKTGRGSDAEKAAATEALVRLRGEAVNETIVATAGNAEPDVRIVLLGVLAGRNARDALPQVKEAAADPNAAVRSAAVKALRYLADKDDVPALITILRKAANDDECYTTELALLTVCSRVGNSSTEALIAGLKGADTTAQLALLRALARVGDEAAMKQTVALARDGAAAVQDEAIRLLANWNDNSVVETLLELAKSTDRENHRVLALRGVVRLAAPSGDQSGDIELLKQVMQLSKRVDERRLVLGAVSGMSTAEALDFAVEGLQLPALSDEAALAVIRIAAKMGETQEDKSAAAVKQALGAIKNEKIRTRANELLQAKHPG
jgi:HEAT repeat protein